MCVVLYLIEKRPYIRINYKKGTCDNRFVKVVYKEKII